MENLNAEQIIKALECCTRGRKSKDDRPCLECPYNECNVVGGTSERQIKGTCQGWLMKDALALINSQEQRIGAQDMTILELRQRAEKADHDARRYEQRIKELTEENEKLTINMNAYGLTAKRLGEENERLRGERAKFFEYKHGTSVRNALVLTKNKKEFDEFCEAIKADTVREMQERLKAEMSFGRYIQADQIDQIAKEMLEGENGN